MINLGRRSCLNIALPTPLVLRLPLLCRHPFLLLCTCHVCGSSPAPALPQRSNRGKSQTQFDSWGRICQHTILLSVAPDLQKDGDPLALSLFFFTCAWCVIQKSRNYKVTKRRQLIKSLPLYKTNSALLAHSDWMQLKPWRVCKTAHVSVAVSCKLRQTWTESNKGINLGIFWSHAFILKWHTSPRLCHVFPDLSESLLWRK